MKIKESIGTKIIKRWFGIHGPLDEYKRMEIGRIATNAYMILAAYMVLSGLVAAIFAEGHTETVLMLLVMGNIIMAGFLINIYILITTNRAHIVDKEIRASSRKQAIKKAVIRGIGLGIYFGVFMFLTDIALDWYYDGTSPIQDMQSLSTIMDGVRAGLFFGIVAGAYDIFTTKVYKE